MRFCGNFYFNSRYLRFQNTKAGCAVILQARAKCFVLQRIKVHYISLQVLLTAAFILWPPCKCGFVNREKSLAVCSFMADFWAVFLSDPHYVPLFTHQTLSVFSRFLELKSLVPRTFSFCFDNVNLSVLSVNS